MLAQEIRALRQYSASTILSIVLAGAIAGVVTLISSVSFAALMFNGELSPFLSTGVIALVSTAVVAGSLFSLLSSCRPVVAMPDDDTAPVLALMVTMIVASFPQGTDPEIVFITAFASLAITALLTGLTLALLGYFRLGSLVRYLPYSVMGGYFAGAGLLLIQGALRVVTDLPLVSILDFRMLVSLDMLWRWAPAIGAAVFIAWAIRNWIKSLAMPLAIFVLILLFFGIAYALGKDPQQLMAEGWLTGPFPDVTPSLVNPVLVQQYQDISWYTVAEHLSSIGTITMLTAISLMLTASGLSVIQRKNIDINRELRVAGLTNTVSGISGGLVALPSMTLTELSMTIGAPGSRLVGLTVAMFCCVMLFFAMPVIAWFPKIILAGLLIYLGGALVKRWLIDVREKLPRLEYLVVIVIVVVVATVGFLEGVVVGLLCAVVLFVVNYSRINVVRYALTGTERRSNVERSNSEQKYLRLNGGGTLILKLQGYLFFGTAAALVSRIEERVEDAEMPPLAYVVLDFAQVTDMDSSAGLSFMKMAQEALKSNFFLLFTGMRPSMQERLLGSWFDPENSDFVKVMPDLDRGVEWCEEQLLKGQALADTQKGIMEQLASFLPSDGDAAILANYMEHRKVEPGDVLAVQDDPSDEMFLLQSCTASVYLETGSGKRHRIRRAGSGTVFGEVGFYLGSARTATVIVDEAGDLYVLSQDANRRLEAEYPHIAAALHKFMIRVITRRLQLTTTTLQAVLT
ncbi:MAG: SulP family inorganic anion transporter [Pseudomonadota bacterium]